MNETETYGRWNALDDIVRAVREIVDSFTSSRDGSFIQDNLTRSEYNQLRVALNRYDRISDALSRTEKT